MTGFGDIKFGVRNTSVSVTTAMRMIRLKRTIRLPLENFKAAIHGGGTMTSTLKRILESTFVLVVGGAIRFYVSEEKEPKPSPVESPTVSALEDCSYISVCRDGKLSSNKEKTSVASSKPGSSPMVGAEYRTKTISGSGTLGKIRLIENYSLNCNKVIEFRYWN